VKSYSMFFVVFMLIHWHFKIDSEVILECPLDIMKIKNVNSLGIKYFKVFSIFFFQRHHRFHCYFVVVFRFLVNVHLKYLSNIERCIT
jgi:hypothetical protein